MDCKIFVGKATGCVATVEPDRQWAGMYRVRFRDGHLTDMVKLTRAKDAATALALTNLNTKPDKEAA